MNHCEKIPGSVQSTRLEFPVATPHGERRAARGHGGCHGSRTRSWGFLGSATRDEFTITTGWWLTNPSEKYESLLGWLLPIYGKIKNVPNHQPDNIAPDPDFRNSREKLYALYAKLRILKCGSPTNKGFPGDFDILWNLWLVRESCRMIVHMQYAKKVFVWTNHSTNR